MTDHLLAYEKELDRIEQEKFELQNIFWSVPKLMLFLLNGAMGRTIIRVCDGEPVYFTCCERHDFGGMIWSVDDRLAYINEFDQVVTGDNMITVRCFECDRILRPFQLDVVGYRDKVLRGIKKNILIVMLTSST